jgi:Peptidase family S51
MPWPVSYRQSTSRLPPKEFSVSVSSSQFRTAILIWVFAASLLQAQESDSTGSATQESAAPIRTDELFPYTGGLVIVGGGGTPDAVRQAFVDLAGGTEGRLVVIPTASEYAERPDAETYYLEDWQPAGFTSLRLLHAPDRETSASAPFLAALREATAVWFSGGDQAVLAERFLDTPVEAELQALLERGGAIGGTSAGAAIQTRVNGPRFRSVAARDRRPALPRPRTPTAVTDRRSQEPGLCRLGNR